MYIPMSQSSPLQPELQAQRPGGMQLPLAHSPLHSNSKLPPTVVTIWMYSPAMGLRERDKCLKREGERLLATILLAIRL